jgi:hypothetical protein
LHQEGVLALRAIELRVGGQVSKLACELESIQSAGLVQLGQGLCPHSKHKSFSRIGFGILSAGSGSLG